MPKNYAKNTWLDRIITGALRYDIKDDSGTSLYTKVQILLNNAVTQAGSQLLATWMNNIETGVDSLDTLLAGVPPQSQYRIVPTVASGALTVALKDIGGNDFSATNPGYFRIANAIRTLTTALSITIPAGVGQFNSGTIEFASNELDIFVAVGWNATDGMTLALTRFPGGSQYGDWSATATNEKYLAVSTATNAASTDYYNIIGRFAATNSGTASYNWSVPAFTAINLKNYPIWNTRVLQWSPQLSCNGSMTISSVSLVEKDYQITHGKLEYSCRFTGTIGGTPSTQILFTLPFQTKRTSGISTGGLLYNENGTIGFAGSYWVPGTPDKAAMIMTSFANHVAGSGNWRPAGFYFI